MTTISRRGYIVGPRDPMQVIDDRDLAEWTIRMVETRSFGIFNATGPNYERSLDATLYGLQSVIGGGATLTQIPEQFLEEEKHAGSARLVGRPARRTSQQTQCRHDPRTRSGGAEGMARAQGLIV